MAHDQARFVEAFSFPGAIATASQKLMKKRTPLVHSARGSWISEERDYAAKGIATAVSNISEFCLLK
jgi:hypothetical protein